jgi:hypothetical protein
MEGTLHSRGSLFEFERKTGDLVGRDNAPTNLRWPPRPPLAQPQLSRPVVERDGFVLSSDAA